jgi:hypothetical protein
MPNSISTDSHVRQTEPLVEELETHLALGQYAVRVGIHGQVGRFTSSGENFRRGMSVICADLKSAPSLTRLLFHHKRQGHRRRLDNQMGLQLVRWMGNWLGE